VLGGGAVGLELGQTYARFGIQVTIVEALDRLLPNDEPEAGRLLQGVLEAEGVAVRTRVRAARVDHNGQTFAVLLDDGSRLSADQLLVATGRKADIRAVGLDRVGVKADALWAPVDDHLRVSAGLWAVGDITGKLAFTHVAMYQARIAIADILDRPVGGADYQAVPRVTFTDPEVGGVGLTEAAARARGLRVRTGVAQLPASARGWIHKVGNDGLIKLVTDGQTGTLIGATSVGPAGGEVLGLLQLAVHAQVPLDRLAEMIYAYPTFYGAVEDALRDLD
jgi:pyruvate/2-oxoglutarate dehydrogenase complex dihydrolipoamide dehydrogenase (E3) component